IQRMAAHDRNRVVLLRPRHAARLCSVHATGPATPSVPRCLTHTSPTLWSYQWFSARDMYERDGQGLLTPEVNRQDPKRVKSAIISGILVATSVAHADCPSTPDDRVCRPWSALLLPTVTGIVY